MTSDRATGQQYEREAKAYFEKQGMRVWKPLPRAVRFFSKKLHRWVVTTAAQDIFGLFDLEAVDAAGDVTYAQVKGTDESNASKARKAIDESGFPYQSLNLMVMCRVPMHKGVFIAWVKGCDGEWIRYRTDEE
jgi:hypothetical protein